jgi:two-component sensor histidine kinase
VGNLLVRQDPSSASKVRHTIAADLQQCAVTAESLDDVLLVISELVGNAVLHGVPADFPAGRAGRPDDFAVSWELTDGEVLLQVGDSSPLRPVPRIPDERRPGGRGLAIVAAIASEWGVAPTGSGKRVWARVPVQRTD